MNIPILYAVNAITNNRIAARLWMIIALFCILVAIASPYLTIYALRQEEKVVIIDPAGTIVYSPLLAFNEAGQLYAYQTKLAVLALLQRNPAGADNPELFQKLYTLAAEEKAAAIIKSQSE